MNHPNSGKLKIGPGGILCPCCVKLPKNQLKVKIRRMERRKQKSKIEKEIQDFD